MKCPFGAECNYAHGQIQLLEKNGTADDKTSKDTKSELSDTTKIPKIGQSELLEESKSSGCLKIIKEASAEQSKKEILIDTQLVENLEDDIGSGLVAPAMSFETINSSTKQTFKNENSLDFNLSPALGKFAENSMTKGTTRSDEKFNRVCNIKD